MPLTNFSKNSRSLDKKLFRRSAESVQAWQASGRSSASKRVSLIQPSDVERYRLWRLSGYPPQVAPVKPVTVKHDLDNLSLFFQWAVRRNYCRENCTHEVERPSDKDASNSLAGYAILCTPAPPVDNRKPINSRPTIRSCRAVGLSLYEEARRTYLQAERRS